MLKLLEKLKSCHKCIFFNKLNRRLVSRTAITQIQNALVSKRSTLLSFKIANRYKFTASIMPDEDKNFRGFLVLDFRKC